MTAPAFTAEPAQPPDPHQDRAATRTTRLLGLVRKLIDFGKDMAAAVQQRPTGDALLSIAMRFGTKSIALMLAGIARGLRLAAELEDRLLGRPTRRPQPVRSADHASSPPKPRAPASPREHNPNAVRTALPKSKEIVARLRPPISSVLLGICSDLGLLQSDPLWQEVQDILIEAGGNLIGHLNDIWDRVASENPFPPATLLTPSAMRPQPAAQPVSFATAATGPP